MAKLRIYKVALAPVDSEKGAVPLSYPNHLGLRTKFGGTPQWVQDEETPTCPHCAETMTFVAQIDSFEHQSTNNPNSRDAIHGNQQFMFGDVGMIYVFFCFDCCEPIATFQGY